MGKVPKSEPDWRKALTPEQYRVLREEGTERRFTSPLNSEYGKGTFSCAGCGQPLFKSEMKFDSKTGWPSFFTAIPGALETKVDRALFMERTEYHCAGCGGHQGHVFEDGPEPTGLRYCTKRRRAQVRPDDGSIPGGPALPHAITYIDLDAPSSVRQHCPGWQRVAPFRPRPRSRC